MREWYLNKALIKKTSIYIIVLITTIFLAVVFDLIIAIEIGILLSAMLLMKGLAGLSNNNAITRELEDQDDVPDPNAIDKKQIPIGVEVYEINGLFFFGAARKFQDLMLMVEEPPKVRILRMRNVLTIDATGLQTLKDFYKNAKKHKTQIILSEVHTQPLCAITQEGIFDLYGEENIYGNIDDALDRAREISGLPKLGRPKGFVPTVSREMN
jgi:sulfate permease, SulP family